jgi:hypothetical protein
MAVHVWQRWFGSLALTFLACSPPDGAGARAPQNQGPRVATSDPPPGARWVGPIHGSDGADCALLERAGTEEGALAALRTAALARGIDFVKVTAVTKPYSDHVCVHKRYRIDGVGYALTPPAPPPVNAAAPASVDAPAPANAHTCTPACAAGYVCRAGACEAECDPACDRSQYCRFDRVCAPLPTAPTAPQGPEAAPLTPAPLPSP